MATKKIPLVFFGSGPVAASSLEGIMDFFEIELVITKPRPAHHKEPAPVEVLADRNSLPIRFAGNAKELDSVIESLEIKSQIGLVIDFGVIVSPFAISRFKKGLINSHFSLLPRWRGADPITYCVLEGDKETGVSLMKIVPKLDDGPLIAQEKLTLPEKIDSQELTVELTRLSNRMLKEYVPEYINGKIEPRPQSKSGVSYSHKISKRDGIIDWTKPADRIEREIRAYAGWPKSIAEFNGIRCIVTEAEKIEENGTPGEYKVNDSSFVVFAGKNAISLKRIKPAGKKEMSIEEFLRGYKSRL